MRQLWYTGYWVSGLTFLALAYVEWQIPGFVSQTFPMYAILIVTCVCGLMSLLITKAEQRVSRAQLLIATGCGLAIAITLFHAAAMFGAYRLVLPLIGLMLPPLLLKTLSEVKV